MSVASLPPPQTTENADGTQTVVFFRINDAGNKVKVTRRVRVETREAHVAETRRTWVKYGDAVREQVKPQHQEEIVLRLFPKTAKVANKNPREEKKVSGKKLSCSLCQNEHYTFQCPLKDKLATAGGPGLPGGPGIPHSVSERMAMGAGRLGQMSPASGAAGGKYVSPAMRGLGSAMGSKYIPPAMRGSLPSGIPGIPMMGGPERDETATLRVSNLPDEISDQDLRQNFGQVGRIVRCHLARHKATGRSRGFAFVVYTSHEEAERARKRFDNMAVGNMIMHVDFAQPRE